MNAETPPVKPKPTPPAERLFPGKVLSGFLIVLLVIVLYFRISHEWNETGWLDEAGANLATYAATIICSIAVWSWFSFRSTYTIAYRRTGMIAGLAIAAFFMGAVRLDGLTGNWIPLGWRWSWQPPRDFARAKPRAVNVAATTSATHEPPPVIATTPNDFPQFLGPRRDGYLPDVKLSHDWAINPPHILWRKEYRAER